MVSRKPAGTCSCAATGTETPWRKPRGGWAGVWGGLNLLWRSAQACAIFPAGLHPHSDPPLPPGLGQYGSWLPSYVPVSCQIFDSFSEEITALSSEVQDKTVSWPFASWDALEEYLGRNVLDNLTLEEAARGPDITFQGSRGKRTNILLMAHFNEQGLVCVTAKSNHLIDGIQIGTGAQLYTELMRASVEARGGEDPGLVTQTRCERGHQAGFPAYSQQDNTPQSHESQPH